VPVQTFTGTLSTCRDGLDWAIAEAARFGLRLILTFTNAVSAYGGAPQVLPCPCGNEFEIFSLLAPSRPVLFARLFPRSQREMPLIPPIFLGPLLGVCGMSIRKGFSFSLNLSNTAFCHTCVARVEAGPTQRAVHTFRTGPARQCASHRFGLNSVHHAFSSCAWCFLTLYACLAVLLLEAKSG
jgi:hypothetical protein